MASLAPARLVSALGDGRCVAFLPALSSAPLLVPRGPGRDPVAFDRGRMNTTLGIIGALIHFSMPYIILYVLEHG
jgi:hypothetical protein